MTADKSKPKKNPLKIPNKRLLREAWWAYKHRPGIPGVGRAGYANTACRGFKEDGTLCNRRALAGGYYCKAHTPK